MTDPPHHWAQVARFPLEPLAAATAVHLDLLTAEARATLADTATRATGSRDDTGRRAVGAHSDPTAAAAGTTLDSTATDRRNAREIRRSTADLAETARFIRPDRLVLIERTPVPVVVSTKDVSIVSGGFRNSDSDCHHCGRPRPDHPGEPKPRRLPALPEDGGGE